MLMCRDMAEIENCKYVYKMKLYLIRSISHDIKQVLKTMATCFLPIQNETLTSEWIS